MTRRARTAMLLTLGFGLGPLWTSPDPAATRQPPPAADFGLLDPADYEPGDIFEGDGPPIEAFAPDAFPEAPRWDRVDEIPAPEGYPVDFRHYPRPEAILAFLDALARDHPDRVEVLEIGRSHQGRPIRAVRVAKARPGENLADRPAMYVDGQHHARELISNQVALYTLWYLVHFYGRDPLVTHLLDSRVLYLVPSVNPDGNAIALEDYQEIRKTANPDCCDDDGDGAVDEDHARGYGYGSDTVSRYTFRQEWADRFPDDPFQDGWREAMQGSPEALGRFTGALGGPRQPIPFADTDGDGRFEEDPVGGVDANRNYAYRWERGVADIGSDLFRGPEPFSEPETRAVRDFVFELDHLATGISFHSGVDVILYPWGASGTDPLPDEHWFIHLGRKGSQLTEVNGFAGSPRTWTARGLYSGTGSTMDHLYSTKGALTFTPEVYGGSLRTRVERVGASGSFTVGVATGFAFNPRPDQILASTDRWNRFTLYLLAATPNIELNRLAVVREHLELTLGNDGALPVALEVSLDGHAGGRLRLDAGEPLNHGQRQFRLPLGEIRPTGNRLVITATLATRQLPHRVERAHWVFSLGPDGAPRLDEGELRGFRDLGRAFGGWWAGPEWNAERYRCYRQYCEPLDIPAPPQPGWLPRLHLPFAQGGPADWP